MFQNFKQISYLDGDVECASFHQQPKEPKVWTCEAASGHKAGVWPLVERVGPPQSQALGGQACEEGFPHRSLASLIGQNTWIWDCEYPPFLVLPDRSFRVRVQCPAVGRGSSGKSGEHSCFPFRLVFGTWGVGVRSGGTCPTLQSVLEGAFSKGGWGWPGLETKVPGREDKR